MAQVDDIVGEANRTPPKRYDSPHPRPRTRLDCVSHNDNISTNDSKHTPHALPYSSTNSTALIPPDCSRDGDVVSRFIRAYRRPHLHSHSHAHSEGSRCLNLSHPDSELWLKDIDEVHSEVSNDPENVDVERGPPNYERFVLNIDGLKCGCCEGGISRVVSRMPAIRNYQINIVMARLEFDLDTNRTSIEDIIKKLDSATGYSFEQNSKPIGQVLEFIHTNPEDFAKTKDGTSSGFLNGVTAIEMPTPDKQFWNRSRLWTADGTAMKDGSADAHHQDKAKYLVDKCIKATRQPQLFRIHYDGQTIGARTVHDFYRSRNQDITLAPPPTHPGLTAGARQTRRALYYFLPTLALTTPVLVFAWAPVDHEKLVYAHASLALASIVQIIAWIEFVPGAIRSLWYSHVFDMDFLITLSTTAAYVFSVVSYAFQVHRKPLDSGSFFETSTLLVALILLGRVINEFARYRAAKAVSFRSLQIDKALLVDFGLDKAADPQTKEIDARLLQHGDYFKVLPHTRLVTDGVVVFGGSEVDESMLTGESIPVAKGVYSRVYAGTMNGTGTLIVHLTNLPHENSVHKIASMVECAELTKPKIQALADRIAGWFVPAIAAVGSIVFVTWLLVDRFHNKHDWQDVVVKAITYAIATLIVSCPCAIGLAVPMVVLIAGGVAARYGIVFRDPQKLEVVRNITDVVFDKTGTLTTGTFSVVDEHYQGTVEPMQVKRILLGLLKDNTHPISTSVYNHLSKNSRHNLPGDIQPIPVINISSLPGDGIVGYLQAEGHQVRAGNPNWLSVPVEETNCSYLCVTIQSKLCATFKLRDTPKRNAETVISMLQTRNITVHMISGDSQGSVDAMAHSLNIPKCHTKSRSRPEGKSQYIRDLQLDDSQSDSKPRCVLFVGDGTNDAIALKQADVGVHMHTPASNTDVAKQAADVVLMTERLGDVVVLLDISRAAYRRILVNFAWSALYNVSAVLLASGALVGAGRGGKEVRIPAKWAGLGELVSVVPVVGVAFSMRWGVYKCGVEG